MNNEEWIRRVLPLSDKVQNGFVHTYCELAEKIGPEGKVLELGVRQGVSLYMWQFLFPSGIVVGVDNNAEGTAVWPPGSIMVVANQDTQEMADTVHEAVPVGYDLIIDDASHVGQLTAKSFELLWPQVRPGCWYVIEDWHLGYLEEWSHWHGTGDSMLKLATKLLTMFGHQADRYPGIAPGEIDEIRYLWGMIIIHKSTKKAIPK